MGAAAAAASGSPGPRRRPARGRAAARSGRGGARRPGPGSGWRPARRCRPRGARSPSRRPVRGRAASPAYSATGPRSSATRMPRRPRRDSDQASTAAGSAASSRRPGSLTRRCGVGRRQPGDLGTRGGQPPGDRLQRRRPAAARWTDDQQPAGAVEVEAQQGAVVASRPDRHPPPSPRDVRPPAVPRGRRGRRGGRRCARAPTPRPRRPGRRAVVPPPRGSASWHSSGVLAEQGAAGRPMGRDGTRRDSRDGVVGPVGERQQQAHPCRRRQTAAGQRPVGGQHAGHPDRRAVADQPQQPVRPPAGVGLVEQRPGGLDPVDQQQHEGRGSSRRCGTAGVHLAVEAVEQPDGAERVVAADRGAGVREPGGLGAEVAARGLQHVDVQLPGTEPGRRRSQHRAQQRRAPAARTAHRQHTPADGEVEVQRLPGLPVGSVHQADREAGASLVRRVAGRSGVEVGLRERVGQRGLPGAVRRGGAADLRCAADSASTSRARSRGPRRLPAVRRASLPARPSDGPSASVRGARHRRRRRAPPAGARLAAAAAQESTAGDVARAGGPRRACPRRRGSRPRRWCGGRCAGCSWRGSRGRRRRRAVGWPGRGGSPASDRAGRSRSARARSRAVPRRAWRTRRRR